MPTDEHRTPEVTLTTLETARLELTEVHTLVRAALMREARGVGYAGGAYESRWGRLYYGERLGAHNPDRFQGLAVPCPGLPMLVVPCQGAECHCRGEGWVPRDLSGLQESELLGWIKYGLVPFHWGDQAHLPVEEHHGLNRYSARVVVDRLILGAGKGRTALIAAVRALRSTVPAAAPEGNDGPRTY